MPAVLDLTGQSLELRIRRGTDALISLEIEGVDALGDYTAFVCTEGNGGRVFFDTSIVDSSIVFTITHAQSETLVSTQRWLTYIVDDADARAVLAQGNLIVLEFGPNG